MKELLEVPKWCKFVLKTKKLGDHWFCECEPRKNALGEFQIDSGEYRDANKALEGSYMKRNVFVPVATLELFYSVEYV